MLNIDLSNIILADNARITEAISTGAAWEIWMQVELIILLRQANIQAAREVPYPPPNAALHLDALAQDDTGQYAIELKVESATNAGAALLAAALGDVAKIANYTTPVAARWVVAIGYSAAARNALNGYAAVPGNNAIYNVLGAIGCMVVTV